MGMFTCWDGLDRHVEDRVELLVLVLDWLNGLTEDPVGESKGAERVSEACMWLSYNELVKLHAAGSDNHGCGGSDGGDDLSCNELDSVSWGLLDVVVSGSEVGEGGHEVNMAI